MDQQRFDELVRNLGATNSRRTVLKGLLAGAVGSAVALVGGGGALAKQDDDKKDKKGHPKKKDCCPESAPSLCDLHCVDTQSDQGNCGVCGNSCPSGTTCENGQCVATQCTSGQTQSCNTGLPGICAVGLQTCTSGSWGACVQTVFPQAETCNGIDDDCDGQVDNGAICGSGETCQNGQCIPNCPSGMTDCSGTCVDESSDALNCGACGHVCPQLPNATVFCSGGNCAFTCNSGFLDCDNNPADGCEVNADNDPLNCGACGHVCGANASCIAGVCQSCDDGNFCTTDEIDINGICVHNPKVSGTVCEPATCTGATYTPPATCNGAGACQSGTSTDCTPFACGPTGCKATCSQDVDCASGFFCSGGTCVMKLPSSSLCTGNNQCASGSCNGGNCA